MGRTWLVSALILAGVGALWAGDSSKADRERLLAELAESRALLLGELDGLSDEQARFQPAENKWAVIHTLEHIVLAEDTIRGLIGQLLTGEQSSREQPTAATDERVAQFVVDRTQKFDAPQRVQPTGKYRTLEEGIQAFQATRRSTVELIEGLSVNLRDYRAKNPVLGEIDGVQWVTFLSGHSRRHTQQIREIKAAENFPLR